VLAVAISVASAAAGYAYGASRLEKPRSHERPTNVEGQDQSSPTDDEDSVADGDLSVVTAGFLQPCKLVRRANLSYFCKVDTPD
jgi:hypothetical protein